MSTTISPLTRAHEWLADHCSWVQYPDVRRAVLAKRQPLWIWKYEMPWEKRLAIALGGFALLGVSLVLLTMALFVLYVIFATLLGF